MSLDMSNSQQNFMVNINTIYSMQERGEQLLFQKNVISVVVKNFTQKKVAHQQDCIVRNVTNGLNG